MILQTISQSKAMVYLTNFHFPTQQKEENYLHSYFSKDQAGSGYHRNAYPFGVLSGDGLYSLDFEPITILYGSNGSGKSTVLNVIGQKLKAQRSSPYNTSEHMDEYVRLCDFSTDMMWSGEEFDVSGQRSSQYDISEITHVITSDDIFRSLMNDRVRREQTLMKSRMLMEKQRAIKYGRLTDYDFGRHIDFEHGNGAARYSEAVVMRKKSLSRYLNDKLGKEESGMSNGENSFIYISEIMQDEGLYLLDEPENSLSPEMQYKLSQLIAYMARYNHCQVLIATHSPFLLGTPGAKIYDLDADPATVHRYEELEAMRFYYQYFKERSSEFDK